jgi:hypothetical protein
VRCRTVLLLATALACERRHSPRPDTLRAAPAVERSRSGTPSAPPAPSGLPGCYRLALGPWSGPFPSGWPAAHQPPAHIRLDSAPLPPPHDRDGYRRVEPDLAAFGGGTVPPGWRAVRADSLEAYWSNGFAGVTLALAARGDSLRGTAHAFHDVVGPGVVQPTAAVRAARVPCERGPGRPAGG